MEIKVFNNNVEKALKVAKKKLAGEGLFRELKRRRFYEKPSVRKKAKLREARRSEVAVETEARVSDGQPPFSCSVRSSLTAFTRARTPCVRIRSTPPCGSCGGESANWQGTGRRARCESLKSRPVPNLDILPSQPSHERQDHRGSEARLFAWRGYRRPC